MKPSGDSRGARPATISRRVMKKPLIGSEIADAGDAAKEPGAEIAEPLTRRREAAGDGLVGTRVPMTRLPSLRDQGGVHFRQDRFVVLEIAVDDGDEIGAGGEPPLDHGAGETDAVDAPQAAQPRVAAAMA